MVKFYHRGLLLLCLTIFSWLAQAQPARIIGTTSEGGTSNNGVIYSVGTDGSDYKVLHHFNGADGTSPYGITKGIDGFIYGYAFKGGKYDKGLRFRLKPSGFDYLILHNFTGIDTDVLYNSLIKGMDGNLYGVDNNNIFKLKADSSDYTILHTLDEINGSINLPLIQGKDGKLYGTTNAGGSLHMGSVFSIQTDGSNYKILHDFNDKNDLKDNLEYPSNNGRYPTGPLIQRSDGKLYGLASGGIYFNGAEYGVLYTIGIDGLGYNVVEYFTPQEDFPYYPRGQLIEATDGILYGSVSVASATGNHNGMDFDKSRLPYGYIFSVNLKNPYFKLLHIFEYEEMSIPIGPLTQGIDGKIYGVSTLYNFFSGKEIKKGILYSLNSDGSGYTVLKDFKNIDGVLPGSHLLFLNNCPVFTFNLSSLPTASVGNSYSLPLSASGGVAPYSYSKLAGNLPIGITLSSNGVLSGTPTTSGIFNFTIKATDINGCTGEVSQTLSVNKANQAITFPPLPDRTFGDSPFIFSATSTSGLPITFTIPVSSKNIISIKGDTVTILKAGKATIIANQAGNDVYNKADSVSVSFNILASPVQNLLLTSLCSDRPALQRKWRVRNSNTFPVTYNWEVYPNIQTGNEIAQPGDNYFTTNTVDGANTTKIYWLDQSGVKKETVKASGGEDCKANCFATSVVNFSQGKTKKGSNIEAIRSDPKKALGAPQDNDTYNFVSLGFGGSITLELAQPLYDNNGYKPDFILVETSFGRADEKCFGGGNTFNYPETAVIEVSDGVKWKSLPNEYCRTSFVDISSVIDNNFKFVKLIRIKDFSNKDYFDANSDGFDVDGIIVCPDEVEKGFTTFTDARTSGSVDKLLWDSKFYNRAPNEAIDEEKVITIYPNPVGGDIIKLDYPYTSSQSIEIDIYNSEGTKVSSTTAAANPGNNTYDINISKLKNGLYVIRVLSQGQVVVKKFVKL